jgi:hypothetical protein
LRKFMRAGCSNLLPVVKKSPQRRLTEPPS